MLKKVNYIFDKRQKRNLLILFIAIFIGGGMELLGVSLIMPLVTTIMEPGILETNQKVRVLCEFLNITDQKTFVLMMLIILIIVYIVKNIYLIIMYSLQYKFTYNNQRRLAIRLMTCYMKQDYLFHLSKNTSELLRNVTVDIEQFFAMILNSIQLLSELFTCIFLIFYLITIDLLTTCGVALIIGMFTMCFYIWFRKSMVILGERYREENAKRIKWIHQSFEGIKEIKVMNRESYFLERFDNCYQRFSIIQRRQSLMQIIPKPILESISICGLLIMIAFQVVMGEDMEQFVSVLSVFAIAAFRMLPAFNRITAYLGAIMFTKASVNAVYDDIREVEKLQEMKKIELDIHPEIQLKAAISIENMCFSYPNMKNNVLDNVNLEIPAYKSVSLIGPSGAGKTTLADVILGLLRPQKGNITVDGKDVYEYLYSWHQVLGYIPQVIYLIDDTIRNNVTFGLPENEIDEEQVWKALKEAQLDEFVRSLEDGLDTIVGERGVRLSGGQRQRIGIARALYHDPQILVLDEATSALDNETETAVMEAVESLQGSRTMIIIAHRLTTIQNCDFVYEVNSGKVIHRKKDEVLK